MIIICGFAVKSVLHQAEVNRLKNDFIATVTHELKTPLASMRVLVDTLLEGSYNDQRQAVEYLGLISKENKRLTGLIDNFLTFSRMEQNKQAFDMSAVCPADIANDAAEAVRTKLSGGDCKFDVCIAEDIADVYADRDAMVTVLVNLLDNAYKYSGDEKVITLEVFADGDEVCFKITDNGIGISPRISRRIFEKFYQADNTLSRTAEGCGLGLSIVKFIVDAHEASVEVQSTPGKGSVFTVKLQSI
jgi:signal transduction histidine kinase